MFFDTILLSPQHKARFWHAWVAATRGIKALNKKQIRGVDIVKLSIDIMMFLKSESSDPSKRFSLRLSAILVNGTVKLHREQLILFQNEIVHFLTEIKFHHVPISIPRDIASEIEFETPPTPPVKKPRKKKDKKEKKAQNTPESLVDIESVIMPKLQLPLEFPEASKARLSDITLREDAQAKTIELSMLPDDFGEPAIEKPAEPLQRRRSRSPQSPQYTIQPRALVEPQPQLEMVQPPEVPPGDSTLQPEGEPQPQIEHPSEMENIIKILEEEITARPRVVKEVIPPVMVPEEISTLPPQESVVQAPEDVAQAQESVAQAQESVAQAPEGVAQRQESVAPIQESIIQQVADKEEEAKKDQQEPKKKSPEKEKKTKKRGDSKKKEEVAKRTASITFLTDKRKDVKNSFASVQQKVATIKANIPDVEENKFPSFIPFFNATGTLIDEFWAVDLVGREVVREGRSPRRTSSVGALPPSASMRSTTLSVSTEGQQPGNLSTPLLPSPAIPPPAIPLPARVATSTPTKRTATEIQIEEEIDAVVQAKKQKIAKIPAPEISPPLEVTQPEVPAPEVGIDQPSREHAVEKVVPPVVEMTQPTVDGVEQIPQIEVESRRKSPELERSVDLSKMERHQKIIDILLGWDFTKKELHIDNICAGLWLKPVKINMARLFSDFLILGASRYVSLITEENSTAFKCIRKGSKL